MDLVRQIVIVGAMFKIMHWPGAGPMLVIGLSTEAVIFIFSAFEPIHEDPDWTLVYPELALVMTGIMIMMHCLHVEVMEKVHPLRMNWIRCLKKLKLIVLLERLGDGMRALGENAAQLKGVTSAAAATDSYVDSLASASTQVKKLSESYERASESIDWLDFKYCRRSIIWRTNAKSF
jgi:gliding motility-associated protein GldL